MSKEEECESAEKNPMCPYLTQITSFGKKLDGLESKYGESQTSMAGLKTDVGWLKKGYWIQIGILLSLLGLVISLFGRGG